MQKVENFGFIVASEKIQNDRYFTINIDAL